MNSTTFPIAEVKESSIISIGGNIGHFFRLTPPDLEQMCDVQKKSLFERVLRDLNNLESETYFKFYKIGDGAYLETNSKEVPSISGVEITPENNALNIFFEGEQIFSDIGIYNDYLSYNGQYIRIFSVLEYSEDEISSSFLPEFVDYILIAKKYAKDKSISRLERIRSGHLSSFLKPKRDLSSETTYSQAEELLSDVISGYESLFETELYFLVKDNSLSGLNEKSREFHQDMISRGIKVFSEGQSLKDRQSGLASIFNELIPGVKPSFSLRSLPNKTSHLRYLLPLSKSSLSNKGILYHDTLNREVFFNPFLKSFKNRNMLVSGMSGTGKSVFVNKLIHNLVDNHPTVILDMGGSYKRLSMYHGGIELDGGFNPFHFKDPIYLREIILSVADNSKFDKLERGKLLAKIKTALPEVNSFFELLERLEESFVGIKYYFEEIKDHITNEPLKEAQILYVDIENLPKGIVSPMIIYILEYFKNIKDSQKILVFDECWEYLTDHVYFVSKCFRTFRKTGALPIAISQSLIDFKGKSDALYTAITNNSFFNILLPQEIAPDSGLDKFDASKINALDFEKGEFSECYLKTKDQSIRKVIRNYLTPLEYELSHTESGEDELLLNFVNKFQDCFSSTSEAINAFVRLKYENTNDYNYFNALGE